MTENEIATLVIGAAIEVHRELGPGLLESVYEQCLNYELKELGLKTEIQVAIPVTYKKVTLNANFRVDLIVEDKVILELKSVSDLHPIFTAQLMTYLHLTNLKLGLIINFNEVLVKKGIRRIVNGL
jgi:GxxExxY protein